MANTPRPLPDRLARNLRLLICGTNPSPATANAGIAYFRPGNRFWPAGLAAGLVGADRDPDRALRVDRVGFTDFVARVEADASKISADELRAGAIEVEAKVRKWKPAAVCFTALGPYRAAVDRRAAVGRAAASLRRAARLRDAVDQRPQRVDVSGRAHRSLPSGADTRRHRRRRARQRQVVPFPIVARQMVRHGVDHPLPHARVLSRCRDAASVRDRRRTSSRSSITLRARRSKTASPPSTCRGTASRSCSKAAGSTATSAPKARSTGSPLTNSATARRSRRCVSG